MRFEISRFDSLRYGDVALLGEPDVYRVHRGGNHYAPRAVLRRNNALSADGNENACLPDIARKVCRALIIDRSVKVVGRAYAQPSRGIFRDGSGAYGTSRPAVPVLSRFRPLTELDSEYFERSDFENGIRNEERADESARIVAVDRPHKPFGREGLISETSTRDRAVIVEIEHPRGAIRISVRPRFLRIDIDFEMTREKVFAVKIHLNSSERSGKLRFCRSEECALCGERTHVCPRQVEVDVTEYSLPFRKPVFGNNRFAVAVTRFTDDDRDRAVICGNVRKFKRAVRCRRRIDWRILYGDRRTADGSLDDVFDRSFERRIGKRCRRGERKIFAYASAVRLAEFLAAIYSLRRKITVLFHDDGIRPFRIDVFDIEVTDRIRRCSLIRSAQRYARAFDEVAVFVFDRAFYGCRRHGNFIADRQMIGIFRIVGMIGHENVIFDRLRFHEHAVVGPAVPSPILIDFRAKARLVYLRERNADRRIPFDHELRIGDHDFYGIAYVVCLRAVVARAVELEFIIDEPVPCTPRAGRARALRDTRFSVNRKVELEVVAHRHRAAVRFGIEI